MPEDVHDDTWINDLPTPLVGWCYSALHGAEAHLRHFESVNVFENLVKLMAMPCLAAYIADLNESRKRDEAIQTQLESALPTPSFGDWVQALNALAKYFSARTEHPLNALHAALNQHRRAADSPATVALFCRLADKQKTKCTLRELLNQLTPYRNGNTGHPTVPHDVARAAEVLPLMSAAIREILSDQDFPLLGPRGSRLVYVDKLEKREDEYEVQWLELKGTLPARSKRVVNKQDADRLNPKRVGVLWPNEQLPISLDPLLIYREQEKQTLYFDAKQFRQSEPKAHQRWGVLLRLLIPSLSSDRSQRFRPQTLAGLSQESELLPYLVDRTEQEFCVEDVLERAAERAAGVKVFIIPGVSNQCHREFWNRLCRVTLPRLNHEPVDDPWLDCPFDSKRNDRTQFERLFSRELRIRIGAMRAGPTGIEVIQSGDQPRIVYTYLVSTHWNSVLQNQVDWFLHFWEKIELTDATKPQLVCLGIKYVNGTGWWGRRWQAKKNSALRSWLDRLDPRKYPGITLTKVPELPDVTPLHVADWVHRYFHSDRRMQEFAERVQSMPMQQFVDEFEKIVTAG